MTVYARMPGQPDWKIYPWELTMEELLSNEPYEIRWEPQGLTPSDTADYHANTTAGGTLTTDE